jgi:hypothetical protein
MTTEQVDSQVSEMFGEKENVMFQEALLAKVDSHQPGTILKGKMLPKSATM